MCICIIFSAEDHNGHVRIMILRLFGGLKRQCVVKHYVRHLKVAQNFVLRCARMSTNDPIKLKFWTDTQFHPRNVIVMSEILYFDVWTSNLPPEVKVAQRFIQMLECQQMIGLNLKFLLQHIFTRGSEWLCQNHDILTFKRAKTSL